MRVLVLLLAAAGFGAFWLFNTEALILLGADCVMGACGVPPVFLAIAAATLALAAAWSWRRPPPAKPRGKRAARPKKPAKPKPKPQPAP